MAKDYSYLGSGIILIREWNSGQPLEEVGNVSAYSFSPQTNTIELADGQNPGGGPANSVDRVTGYNLSYTFHDFKPSNFARSLRGVATAVAAATIADEAAAAAIGAFVPLARIAAEVTSVKNTGGTTTYEAGKDYRLERGMLFIPAGSTIPAAVNGAPNIKVSYKHGAIGRVEVGVTSQKFYEVHFVGINEAQGGKLVRAIAHKVKGGMLNEMGLLGDQFAAGTVAGALVKDSAKATGPDISPYFYWEQEE